MVEILLFAILSVYLFYRLWSVLGTRTGNEKQRQWPRLDDTESNVIVLPNKNVQKEATEIIAEPLNPFEKQVEVIQQSLKNFSVEKFQAGACNAFRAVLTAFAASDEKRLEQLVSPKVANGFQKAIQSRKNQKESINIDIKDVESEIEHITVNETNAEIVVRFTSDQVVVTMNEDGEIIDNTNKLTNRMIDRWTFQKNLGNAAGPSWVLVKTESVEL